MPEHPSAEGHPKIGFTSTMLVQVGEEGMRGSTQAIKVEVDEELVNGFVDKGKDRELMKAYFEKRVNDVLTLNRILGLSLVGLKKITITTHLLPGAVELVTFNEELFSKLRPRPNETSAKLTPLLRLEPQRRLWVCAEDEGCLCSWCIEPEP